MIQICLLDLGWLNTKRFEGYDRANNVLSKSYWKSILLVTSVQNAKRTNPRPSDDVFLFSKRNGKGNIFNHLHSSWATYISKTRDYLHNFFFYYFHTWQRGLNFQSFLVCLPLFSWVGKFVIHHFIF